MLIPSTPSRFLKIQTLSDTVYRQGHEGSYTLTRYGGEEAGMALREGNLATFVKITDVFTH